MPQSFRDAGAHFILGGACGLDCCQANGEGYAAAVWLQSLKPSDVVSAMTGAYLVVWDTQFFGCHH